jgi:hypothetical protein
MKRKGQDINKEVNELRQLLIDQSIDSKELLSIFNDGIVSKEKKICVNNYLNTNVNVFNY